MACQLSNQAEREFFKANTAGRMSQEGFWLVKHGSHADSWTNQGEWSTVIDWCGGKSEVIHMDLLPRKEREGFCAGKNQAPLQKGGVGASSQGSPNMEGLSLLKEKESISFEEQSWSWVALGIGVDTQSFNPLCALCSYFAQYQEFLFCLFHRISGGQGAISGHMWF